MSELEHTAAAATARPWRVDPFDDYLIGPTGDKIHWDAEGLGATWGNDADAALIVFAVNNIEPLVKALRALIPLVPVSTSMHQSPRSLRIRALVEQARTALRALEGGNHE